MRWLVLCGLILVGFAPCANQETTSSSQTTKNTVSVQGTQEMTYSVEIADSEAERQTGLMNRTSLDESAGMLFIFNQNVRTSFFMKDTFISLDIIFIDENSNIIFIAENTVPLSTDLITPDSSFRYVLEINAGQSVKNGFAVGNKITLNL